MGCKKASMDPAEPKMPRRRTEMPQDGPRCPQDCSRSLKHSLRGLHEDLWEGLKRPKSLMCRRSLKEVGVRSFSAS
eukprot:3169122-Pyramimonas_sp.AAC.1